MEPICFKVPRQKEETVRVEYWDLPYFYEPFHFHKEYQLTYIERGKGMLFVGSMLNAFSDGNLYLIGKNLPHVFRNDDEYYFKNSNLRSKAISVFFSSESMIELFKQVPEMRHLNKLLDNSLHGIKLESTFSGEAESLMKNMIHLTGYQRLMKLFNLLDLISTNENTELISLHPSEDFALEDDERMDKVFDYIMMHYNERIKLDEMADLANMTSTSFCRYFKLHTKKTFSRFVMEVRINKACKMLSQGGYNVAEACYSAGYNNISNFHRHFRRLTGLTPNEYRKKLNHIYA